MRLLIAAALSLYAAEPSAGQAPEPVIRQAPAKPAPKAKAKPARKQPAKRPAAKKAGAAKPAASKPAAKKAAAAPAVAPAAAQAAKPAADGPRAEGRTLERTLAVFGAAVQPNGLGLLVKGVVPDSPAEELGLKPGDEAAFLQSGPAGSPAEAAAGFRSWAPGTRLSAVLRRDLRVLSTDGLEPSWEPKVERDGTLWPLEQQLRDRRLAASSATARELVAKAPALVVPIPARQAFWLRFPSGLPADTAPGQTLQAEITTAVTTDADLDYLALPPGSAVWVKLLDSNSAGETRQVRLLVYKVQPRGGQVYGVAARLTAISGGQKLAKVSPGGTLVVAEPLPPPGRRPTARWNLVAPSDRLKLELLQPLPLAEAPRFFQAGPGLWFRSKETAEGRVFEVSHVIAGRAAEKAGLKPGHQIVAISGRRSGNLEFQKALELLYGKRGSRVSLSVLRNPQGKPEPLELERGVTYGKNGETKPVPLPYEL